MIEMNAGRALLLLALGVGAACASSSGATSKVATPTGNYNGGDGGTCADAIIVEEDTEAAGVASERAWLDARYPGYVQRYQTLGNCTTRRVDKFGITTTDGFKVEVIFDVSRFRGPH